MKYTEAKAKKIMDSNIHATQITPTISPSVTVFAPNYALA